MNKRFWITLGVGTAVVVGAGVGIGMAINKSSDNNKIGKTKARSTSEALSIVSNVFNKRIFSAAANFNVTQTKVLPDGTLGFNISVDFSNVSGRVFSSGNYMDQMQEYNFEAREMFNGLGEAFSNPIGIEIIWSDDFLNVSKDYFGYFNGMSRLWGASIVQYSDGILYYK